MHTVLSRESLLELTECWHRYLCTGLISSIASEESILPHLSCDSLKLLHELGKSFIEAKSGAEHWEIIIASVDVPKSIRCIKHMQVCWQSRQMLKSGDDLVNHASDEFCWAIMGSELVALKEAARNGQMDAAYAIASIFNFLMFVDRI